jgi:hypothetical protein
MKIKFMGAARTVTGSCYILEVNGHRFAVDCGMHQGNAEIEKRNWDVDISSSPMLILTIPVFFPVWSMRVSADRFTPPSPPWIC